MITKEEFERYCDEHELRRTFDKRYWIEYLLDENWNEWIFFTICSYGYVETAKWLYSLGNIDIHTENEFAFRWSCMYDKKEIVKWFIFELGYINDPIIDEYKICQEIINDKVYKRKSYLMKGYVYGGGTVNHPLSKVSFHNFCRCLMMI